MLARRGVVAPPAAADNVEAEGEGEGGRCIGEGGGRGIVARCEPEGVLVPDDEEGRFGDGGIDMLDGQLGPLDENRLWDS